MTFLSTILGAADAIEREKAAPKPKPVKERMAPKAKRVISAQGLANMRRGSQSRSAKTQAVYAEVFATPTLVAVASARMGISHVACNVQLYRYEKRELVRRVENPDTESRAGLWVWVGK